MMPVRILYLEDNPTDAELIQRMLIKSGIAPSITRVATRPDYETALKTHSYDLIFSDNSLPNFDGHSALQLAQQYSPRTPFIFVSGTIGEEVAIRALQSGATDYVLKDRLGRLASAVNQALTSREEKRKREAAEEALRKTEEQVRQIQKLEAIGQLAGGIAHDFNNLLTVIIGRSQMIMTRLPEDSPHRDELDLILNTGLRAAALTRQLLAFSRKQILQMRAENLNAIVSEMAKMLQRLIGENIHLVLTLSPDLKPVLADASQLEQVIMNLAINARDAMPAGGTLRIETANAVISDASNNQNLTPGLYVVLSMTDSGIGMDAETLQRVFEPFFTTKPAGKGTGLGLSTVYGIVSQSKGSIAIQSEPGKGTRFDIFLPQAPESAEISTTRQVAVAPVARNATILVVEDDDAIREFEQEVLTGIGYTVLAAQDGTHALQAAETYGKPIDLLLTDLIMPDMSGRALAFELSKTCPALRVLLVSGYATDLALVENLEAQNITFLNKPFTHDQLIRKIDEILSKQIS